MARCPRCGSPVRHGQHACHVCGTPFGHAGHAPAAQHHHAQPHQQHHHHHHQPQQHQPPPQQQRAHAPQGQRPDGSWARTSKQRSSFGLGCGLAGLFGVVLVVIAVVVGVSLSATSEEAARRDALPTKVKGKVRVPKGRLRDQVPKKVLTYKLAEAKPSNINGAVQALVATYEGSGGEKIGHELAVFGDRTTAKAALKASKKLFAKKTEAEPTSSDLDDEDGETVGEVWRYRGSSDVIVYRIDKLLGVIVGKNGKVTPFFRALPY